MLTEGFTLKRMFRQTLAILMITLLAVIVPGMAVSGAERGSETAGLSVLSEPSAAVVYLDGESQGLTPLDLDRLSPGDHRITLVKDGYIENSRIVSLEGNRPQTVDVTLTPSNDQMRYSMQIGGGGGGGSKLPLILGIAGGGAVAAVLLLRGSNEPPNPGTVSISPNRIGIAALTNFSFSSSASDADGDPLTFSWDFGDGSTGTGPSVTHVFNSGGSFTVTVTVSDGDDSAMATGSVTVRDINGTWRDPGLFGGATLTLTQNGTNVTGTYRGCGRSRKRGRHAAG